MEEPLRRQIATWTKPQQKVTMRSQQDYEGWWLGVILILFIVYLFDGCVDLSNKSQKSPQYLRETFEVWQRHNPGHQMSFEDWYVLYLKNLLPGQNPNRK